MTDQSPKTERQAYPKHAIVDTPVFKLLRYDRQQKAVFLLQGDVRLEHISYLREAFWEAMNETGISDVVIDLKKTKNFDYTGISLFVSTKNALVKQNGQLILTAVPRQINEIFERTSLNHYFDIRGSVEEAFKSKSSQRSRRKHTT